MMFEKKNFIKSNTGRVLVYPKIPTGLSQSVNRRRIDNTIVKRKGTKGSTMVKNNIQKTKD